MFKSEVRMDWFILDLYTGKLLKTLNLSLWWKCYFSVTFAPFIYKDPYNDSSLTAHDVMRLSCFRMEPSMLLFFRFSLYEVFHEDNTIGGVSRKSIKFY